MTINSLVKNPVSISEVRLYLIKLENNIFRKSVRPGVVWYGMEDTYVLNTSVNLKVKFGKTNFI